MKTSSQTARSQLVASTRNIKDSLLIVPKRFAPYTALEILQRFYWVAPEFKGHSSCTFGEYGVSLTASVSIDFGKFFFPLLKLKPSASISGTLLDESLLIIHRNVPNELVGIQTNAPSSTIWDTSYPVCLMAFSGRKFAASGNLAVSVGISVSTDSSSLTNQLQKFEPNPAFDDLTGASETRPPAINIATLGIGGSISFDVNTSMNLEFYKWDEASPGFYPNGFDSVLETDFKNSLGPLNKQNVSKEVIDWLKYIRDNVLKKVTNPPNNLTALLVQLKDLPIISRFNLRRPGRKASTEQIVARLQALLNDGDESLLTVFSSLDKEQLPNENGNVNLEEEKAALEVQILWYIETLQAAVDAEDYLKNNKSLPSKGGKYALSPFYQNLNLRLCFIDISVFSPSFGASASAWIGTSLSVSKVAGAVGPVNASGAISLDGSFRKMTSRYQTYSLDNKSDIPLVFTQDTNINYTQLKVSRSVNFNLGFTNKFEKGKEWPTYFIKNTMAYNASSLYWLHPDTTDDQQVSLQMGSGISFGFSIGFADLIQIGKGLLSTGPVTEEISDYLTKFSKALRLTEDQFKDFINGLFKSDKDSLMTKNEAYLIENLYPQLIEYDAVLVESSFKIIKPTKVGYSTRSGINSLMSESKFDPIFRKDFDLDTLDTMDLVAESVRIRVRLKDNLNNTDSHFFKLGFFQELAKIGKKSVSGSFPFHLNVIKKAGNEGIFDIHNHWILDSALSDTRRLELAVPPVNLLPHNF